MKYRKLRIAWSVSWGVLCLLLIALWVRSYWTMGVIYAVLSGATILQVSSVPGNVALSLIDDSGASPEMRGAWRNSQTSVESFLAIQNSGSSRFIKFRSGLWLGPTGTYMPFWFPVALAAAVATLSWIPWRFSLRTLLIGMTVAAVGLGLLVYLIK